MRHSLALFFAGLVTFTLAGCVSSPPENRSNICAIFEEKNDWYEDAKTARARWGVPISAMMAIMHQESRFEAKAKPPRQKIFGVIPGLRPSDAYGYSQALGSTWQQYERSAGNYGADRDDFEDAIDFIGWYNAQTHRINGVAVDDVYNLYLAYHEGHGGFKRGTYNGKPWLIDVAKKVDRRAKDFSKQLYGCQKKLESRGWLDW